MRLSESIRRNILQSTAGGIFNRFKLSKRRNTFFFDDIGLSYVRMLEDNGYGDKLREMSYSWGTMLYSMVLPSPIKKLPYKISCNVILRDTLVNLGYMNDMRFVRKGEYITVRTEGEENVKKIGLNNLHIGMFMGMAAAFFRSDVEFLGAMCSHSSDCTYRYRLKKTPFLLSTKTKGTYNRLNELPITTGLTIKDALRSKVFVTSGNKMHFRGKRITAIENTLFHIFSNEGLMLDQVSSISYGYFSEIIRDTSAEKKLKLLKNLLQFMGWGRIRFEMVGRKRIIMGISYPPFGFQSDKDNWEFLFRVVLGYLWLIRRDLRLGRVSGGRARLFAEYLA